jgi:integrase
MESIDQAIEQANQGLSRIVIVRRGRKLALRGSLPKRPGEGRGNKQTTIALGVFANPSGVKVALAKGQRLESDLNMERFTWADWEKSGGSPGGKSAADWGKEYAAVKVSTVKASTYRTNYQERLESLPDKPLTEELLLTHVQQRSKINTKGRRDDCIAFGQLAKFAGLTVDFSSIKGRYEPKPLSPDDVPSDGEIETIWASIANPGWKWVYGMLATYGLRPHEVFRIANTNGIATDTGKISILDDSKTGRRDVWPLPDRWRSQFNLAEVAFPKIRIEGRDNQQLGERVGANLCSPKDRKIPHRPYALRHAWAIRSAVMGVPDSIAARWMGHSVAVHAKTYHAAINQLQHEAIWRRANQLGNSI